MWVIRAILISVLLLSLQSAGEVWGLFSIFGVNPDFRLLLVFWLAQRRGPIAGMLAGFFMGIILDVYAIDHLGASALAGCVAGYLTGLAEEKTLHLEYFARVALFALMSLVFNTVYLLALQKGHMNLFGQYWIEALPGSLYTVVVGALILLVLNRRLVAKYDA